MSIDIKRFCANKYDFRQGLQEVFSYGEWAYASNGHWLVRVPCDTVPAFTVGDTTRHPKNAVELFKKWHDGVEGEFFCMPPLPALDPCEYCDGTGAADDGDECPECFGNCYPFKFFALGDAGYSLHYLRELATLPNVRIRTNGHTNAAALIFDGGQALLMPMRVPEKTATRSVA